MKFNTDIYLHLFMKSIWKNKVMCHTKTMWLHGMIWSKVDIAHISWNGRPQKKLLSKQSHIWANKIFLHIRKTGWDFISMEDLEGIIICFSFCRTQIKQSWICRQHKGVGAELGPTHENAWTRSERRHDAAPMLRPVGYTGQTGCRRADRQRNQRTSPGKTRRGRHT